MMKKPHFSIFIDLLYFMEILVGLSYVLSLFSRSANVVFINISFQEFSLVAVVDC